MMISTLIALALITGVQTDAPSYVPSDALLRYQGGATQAKAFELTNEVKNQTLETLIREMNQTYVMPDIAKKIEAELRKWMAGSDYKAQTDPVQFAAHVNEIIKGQVTDAHLRFRYSPNVLPTRSSPREPSAEEIKRAEASVRFRNAEFTKVERLTGNIGYIAFNGFMGPEDMARPVEGAMRFLANTDAMIVDLRQNGGGDPRGVQLFCSYFFDEKPVHLNSIYFRNGNKGETIEFWTLKKVAGPRYLNKPLYILTSKRTGSGAEECAYNFQQLKRGTTVGSSTWGGANPGGVARLSDHFSCFIPGGRAINPYTKTNWEGTGVKPDVEIDPSKALKHAQLMAIKLLMLKETDPEMKADYETMYKQVESEPDR
ncbi:MAG: S41 family peptidase [Fimbriimonadaceae bacterium]|nr:S41 family peptidase [Fimbriimonadaceae bacterium]